MPPFDAITVCSIARLDTGHLLGRKCEVPVGAATISARVCAGGVAFTLESFVLQPTDAVSRLLSWLDCNLAEDDATFAGYQLSNALKLLSVLPGAHRSPALRAISGHAHQKVIDLSAREVGAGALTFQEACKYAGIACAPVDPAGRFSAWCRSDTDQIAYAVEVDVIAAFRLILQRIARSTPPGMNLTAAMGCSLEQWLHNTDSSAARFHRRDLGMIAG